MIKEEINLRIPRSEWGRLAWLRKLLQRLEVADVKGSLKIVMKGNRPEYYQCIWNAEKNKIIRNYLNKENMHLVKYLAMKSYCEAVKKVLDQTEYKLKSYRPTDVLKEIDGIYESYPQAKMELVEPIVPTYRMMVEKWKAGCITSDYPFGSGEIYTKNGERVRSKSEKILADNFSDKRIEYVYEARLRLEDGTVFYPDFTFLHPRTRELIYWEHNGKMHDIDYVDRAIGKIISYELNGVYRGDKLIVTYESADFSLNQEWVEILIGEFLM